jgi:hypothetical protein
VKRRLALSAGALLIGVIAAHGQQPADDQSCSGKMTEQLRRFNEQCLSTMVSFLASQPKAVARVMGEKAKFYVQLTRTPEGFEGESVSRANFPFMTTETAEALKKLGWTPPDNEEGNFIKRFGAETPGRTAETLAETLAAYGLAKGEAISLTVAVPE